ncbi:MAG: DNA gyrase C-terminal beta-propeller domain-containing protein, partial [Planctomycetota bacterium]
GKGWADIKTSARNGKSVAAIGVLDGDDVMIMTKSGLLVRMNGGSISTIGRGTQGVRIVKLNAGDEVVAVTRVQEPAVDAEEAGEAPADD